jgi:hypothetical protein
MAGLSVARQSYLKSPPGRALAARSAGLNQLYGLGRPPAPGSTPPVQVDPYVSIIGGMEKPMTAQQITAQARGEISPLVAALSQQITGRVAGASHAISGYAGEAARELAQLDFGQPYTGAEQGQAAVDAALRQSLAGAGSSDAEALASRLAVLNDPTVAAAANDVAANGAANGNTQLAQGSAALSNLIANAAAGREYGLKQPGIAKLAGLQQISGVQRQGQSDLAAGTAQLMGQLPGLVESMTSRNDARAQSIATARMNQLGRNDDIALARSKNAADWARQVSKNQTAVDVAQTRAQAQITLARAKADEQAARDARPNATLSRTYGYVVDSNGNWIAGHNGRPQILPGYTVNQHGQVVRVATSHPSAHGPQLTAKEIQDYKGTAATIADNAKTGFTDAQSVKHPPLSPFDALKEMRREGVPDAIAIAAINRAYGTAFNPKGFLP